ANDTVNLLWKLDETVSLESLRIYIAHPLMGSWQIYQGLPQDTTCPFVVPDTQSNMAFKFWVAVSGYLRYDSIVSPPFYIKRRTGIEETTNSQFAIRNSQLLSVYPNPFQNHCVIKFQIPVQSEIRNPKSEISLKVYDATGRLVRQWDYKSATLIGGIRQSAQITWDGENGLGGKLPPGVYFVFFKMGSSSAIKKVL
ncbi:MAG: T9SS type A sorting domain-containing protein, partial [Patescibacteria group bacterium]